MINIGIIRFNSGNYGGIEHQIMNTIENLDSNMFKFILITNNKTLFSSTFEKYGKVYYIDSSKILKASKQVEHIVKENQISIIQSHMLREHYIGCLTKRRLKDNVYHIFRVHTYINCSFISKFRKKLYHVLAFLLSSNVDKYLPINTVNASELIKSTKVNKEKIEVVHDGVRSLESIVDNKKFDYNKIAMIANFEYGKGHDIALKALEILVRNDKKYHITFIGGENTERKPVTAQMQNLAKELKVEQNIAFYGFTDNISEAVKDIDIIILPSYSEGTPNCLLEAMSIKKIVIASAVGGIPEFIQDGVNGFLHKNKEYKELAQKVIELKEISKEQLERIRNNGYEMWNEEYTISKLNHYLSSLYKENGVDVK